MRMSHFGLLIIGHGTRDRRGLSGFQSIVREVSGLVAQVPVEPCFLELAEPTISEGIDRLAARGVRYVAAVPLMLLAAGHVRRDIPAQLDDAGRRHPSLTIRQTPHLGQCSLLLRLSHLRWSECVGDQGATAAEDTCLLLVSRGSRDPEATQEMLRFAEGRRQISGVGRLEVCFLTAEKPSLDEGLRRVAGLPVSKIVVQPHLLLAGYLTGKIERAVGEQRRVAGPSTRWSIAQPLGPHRLVAQAVLDIARGHLPLDEQAPAADRKAG
jgi:sirohydrochlorin cobaltochelatase